jgi:hypothetical protein
VAPAAQTNEIFLLVADVVVSVMLAFEANGGSLQAALEVCGCVYAQVLPMHVPLRDTIGWRPDMSPMCQPYRDFVQRPWWEVATNPDPEGDPVAFQELLKGQAVSRTAEVADRGSYVLAYA